MRKTLQDFLNFALKGNILQLAIGVILGTAFNQMINSLVKDLIMPVFGLILGGFDISNLSLTLRAATATQEALLWSYGAFLQTGLNFLIIALSAYIVVKTMQRFETPKVEEKKDTELSVLKEIRDQLKVKS